MEDENENESESDLDLLRRGQAEESAMDAFDQARDDELEQDAGASDDVGSSPDPDEENNDGTGDAGTTPALITRRATPGRAKVPAKIEPPVSTNSRASTRELPDPTTSDLAALDELGAILFGAVDAQATVYVHMEELAFLKRRLRPAQILSVSPYLSETHAAKVIASNGLKRELRAIKPSVKDKEDVHEEITARLYWLSKKLERGVRYARARRFTSELGDLMPDSFSGFSRHMKTKAREVLRGQAPVPSDELILEENLEAYAEESVLLHAYMVFIYALASSFKAGLVTDIAEKELIPEYAREFDAILKVVDSGSAAADTWRMQLPEIISNTFYTDEEYVEMAWARIQVHPNAEYRKEASDAFKALQPDARNIRARQMFMSPMTLPTIPALSLEDGADVLSFNALIRSAASTDQTFSDYLGDELILQSAIEPEDVVGLIPFASKGAGGRLHMAVTLKQRNAMIQKVRANLADPAKHSVEETDQFYTSVDEEVRSTLKRYMIATVRGLVFASDIGVLSNLGKRPEYNEFKEELELESIDEGVKRARQTEVVAYEKLKEKRETDLPSYGKLVARISAGVYNYLERTIMEESVRLTRLHPGSEVVGGMTATSDVEAENAYQRAKEVQDNGGELRRDQSDLLREVSGTEDMVTDMSKYMGYIDRQLRQTTGKGNTKAWPRATNEAIAVHAAKVEASFEAYLTAPPPGDFDDTLNRRDAKDFARFQAIARSVLRLLQEASAVAPQARPEPEALSPGRRRGEGRRRMSVDG